MLLANVVIRCNVYPPIHIRLSGGMSSSKPSIASIDIYIYIYGTALPGCLWAALFTFECRERGEGNGWDRQVRRRLMSRLFFLLNAKYNFF